MVVVHEYHKPEVLVIVPLALDDLLASLRKAGFWEVGEGLFYFHPLDGGTSLARMIDAAIY